MTVHHCDWWMQFRSRTADCHLAAWGGERNPIRWGDAASMENRWGWPCCPSRAPVGEPWLDNVLLSARAGRGRNKSETPALADSASYAKPEPAWPSRTHPNPA